MMKDMPLEEIRTGPLKGDVPLKDAEALIAPLLIVASVLLRGVRAGLEAERSEGFCRRLLVGVEMSEEFAEIKEKRLGSVRPLQIRTS